MDTQKVLTPGSGLLGPDDLSQGVAGLFERAVQNRPEAPALCVPGETWTYRELNRRANQLAHSLIQLGVTRGEVVAIAMESPQSLAVAILGCLKAGAPTVFLDVKSPPSRQSEILTDCGATVVVLDGDPPSEAASNGEGPPRRSVDLRRTGSARDGNPGIPTTGDDLMSIFYTSGTTNRPKGICRPQSQAVFEAWTFVREMSVTPEDRLLMPVSFTFGASTRYALGALLSGAALCPVVPETLGMSGMLQFAREIGATHYYSTPSLFRHFCKAAASDPGDDRFRAVTLTGEPARLGDLQLFRSLMRGRPGVFLNSLGSTECGAYCHLRLGGDIPISDEILPAGLPLHGKEVFLVDEDRRPVPDGETGEIAVRSAYLSRGYWKRPDLNAQVFDFGQGGRGPATFYTGDLGTRDPQGWIRVTGRKDLQLKVRGYRVEPGEIESALLGFTGIQAAVVTMGETSGQKVLEAYLQPSPGHRDPDRAELDRYLMQRLPSYMIPARYRLVEELPLTERGKVDRRMLGHRPFRVLEAVRQSPENTSPALAELRALWSELLRIPIPRDDAGFFELGGDSVLAVHFLTRVRARWGLAIPVAVFYQSPTLDSAARWIDAGVAFGPDSAVFPMNEQREGLPELIFLPGWMRNTLELQLLARALSGRFNCLGLELPPAGSEPETIEALSSFCAGIIRSRKPSRPVYLGGYSLGGLIAYETGRQLRGDGIPVARVFILDSHASSLGPKSGGQRVRRFFRNLPLHPIRSMELLLRRSWQRIGPPVLAWIPGRSRNAPPPSNFGPMPQRAAAKAYRPKPADLRLSIVYSWERRLQLAIPGEPWTRLTSHPVEWHQLGAFFHERLVKPENLASLVKKIHPVP